MKVCPPPRTLLITLSVTLPLAVITLASTNTPDKATARSDFDPSGSPSENRLPSMCLITPGSTTSAAG